MLYPLGRKKNFWGVVTIIFSLLCFPFGGQGNYAHSDVLGGLSVTPQRIIFEGRNRSAEVLLINNSDKEYTFKIYFKNLKTNADGVFMPAESSEDNSLFADQLIRYAPRRITVEGNKSQKIRLSLRKPRDLAPGEYRSHITFESLPPPEQGGDIEQQTVNKGKGEVSIKMLARFKISIPVIVRHGTLSAKTRLSNLSIKPSEEKNAPSILSAKLERAGNRSVFGDISVSFKSRKNKNEVEVGKAYSIVVYTPNKIRTLKIPLIPPKGIELSNGKLHVVYREKSEEGGKVLAESDLVVP